MIAAGAESNRTMSPTRKKLSLKNVARRGTVRLLFESPGYYRETQEYKLEVPPSVVDAVLTPRTKRLPSEAPREWVIGLLSPVTRSTRAQKIEMQGEVGAGDGDRTRDVQLGKSPVD